MDNTQEKLKLTLKTKSKDRIKLSFDCTMLKSSMPNNNYKPTNVLFYVAAGERTLTEAGEP